MKRDYRAVRVVDASDSADDDDLYVVVEACYENHEYTGRSWGPVKAEGETVEELVKNLRTMADDIEHGGALKAATMDSAEYHEMSAEEWEQHLADVKLQDAIDNDPRC